MTVPDRSTFESAYNGQAPWDIGKSKKAFIDVADQITGMILDAGWVRHGRQQSGALWRRSW